MINHYGGRLGRIIDKYPKLKCHTCNSNQIQIVRYLSGDPEYKCRKCNHSFTLPFTDKDEDIEKDDLLPNT